MLSAAEAGGSRLPLIPGMFFAIFAVSARARKRVSVPILHRDAIRSGRRYQVTRACEFLAHAAELVLYTFRHEDSDLGAEQLRDELLGRPEPAY